MTNNKKVKPRRIAFRPHPDPEKADRGEKIKVMTLDFKIIKEDWNIYELEDGTRVRVKVTATSFDCALDPKTGEVMYKGKTPLYGVGFGVETAFEYSEELVKP